MNYYYILVITCLTLYTFGTDEYRSHRELLRLLVRSLNAQIRQKQTRYDEFSFFSLPLDESTSVDWLQ